MVGGNAEDEGERGVGGGGGELTKRGQKEESKVRHTRHTRLLGNSFIAFTCHKSSAMANSPSLILLLLLLLLLLLFIPGVKPPAGIVYDGGKADAEKMSPCVLDKDGSRPPATDVPVAGMPGRRRRDGCCCCGGRFHQGP